MNEKNIWSEISIKSIIILVFTVSILASVGIIGNKVFNSWRSSAERTTEKIAYDMNNVINSRIDALLHVPEHINEVNHKLLENGILDLTNEAEREKFFVGVLKSHYEEIYSFSYGSKNGEYYGARSNEYGILEIMKNNADTGGHSWYYSVDNNMTSGKLVLKAGKFDPRSRDWYKVAKESGTPIFSPVYKHFIMNDLTVSASCPIYNSNGELMGVLGTHMLLDKIDDYLKEIVKDTNGYAFIAEKKSDEFIANSFGAENFVTLKDGTFKRNKVSDNIKHAVQKAYIEYKSKHEAKFVYKEKNEKYYVNVVEYHKPGLDWVIVSAIPEKLLMVDVVESIRMSIIFTILFLFISAAFFYLIANKLLKPLENLSEAAERLSSGDLSQRATIVRGDEIGKISISFNDMADKMYQLVENLETKVKERTTELECTNDTLKKTKEDLYLLLDSTAEGIFGIDPAGNCTFCNKSCVDLLGYSAQDELLGRNMHRQIHHSSRAGAKMPIESCKIMAPFLTGEKTHMDDEVFWKADGTCFDVEYHSYPQYKEGEIVGAVVTFIDISEKKETEQEIEYLSRHDSLTGLLNRRCFEESLKKYDTKYNLPISVVFADVNGLKLTNDIFGHAAGDMLLKKSAEILKKHCRADDILARVGGDEFILLMPHTEAGGALKVIDIVKQELSKEKINAVKCSMSMGTDTKTDADRDIEETIRNAENEMYKQKSITRKTLDSENINAIMNTLYERTPKEKTHSDRVSQLCEKAGRALGMHETEIKKLRDAGYLHDIGKIVIDDITLLKKGDLTDDELRTVQQHPIIGYRILNLLEEKMDLADAVFSHHENWDGTGYPKALKGEEIPVMSRIIALAETYDRIVSDSEYPEHEAKEKALAEIRKNTGKRFDPSITEVFIGVIESLY